MENDNRLQNLNIKDIMPNRFQPRRKFNEESLNELTESIKEHGVIQPITVRKIGNKYEIVSGERRYKASVLAGKETVPSIIVDLNDNECAEIALIENVQRQDLTPIEEAQSYKKILEMGSFTQESLATKIGKKQSTVANKLRLLNLNQEVQDALLNNKISERHARSLLRLKDHDQQIKMLNRIINERLTVRKTDEEIQKELDMNERGNKNMDNNNFNEIPNINTNNPLPENQQFSAQVNNQQQPESIDSLIARANQMQDDYSVPVMANEQVNQQAMPDMNSFANPNIEVPVEPSADVTNYNIPSTPIEESPEKNANSSDLRSVPVFNIGRFDNENNNSNEIPYGSNEIENLENNALDNQTFNVNFADQNNVSEIDNNNSFNYEEPQEIMPKMPEMATAPIKNLNINQAVDEIRNSANRLENMGFKIDSEEFDLDNAYQIIIRISK